MGTIKHFLLENGFRMVVDNHTYANGLCIVIITEMGIQITDNIGWCGAMGIDYDETSEDNIKYWLFGVLMFYSFTDGIKNKQALFNPQRGKQPDLEPSETRDEMDKPCKATS